MISGAEKDSFDGKRFRKRRRIFKENTDINKIGGGHWDFDRMTVEYTKCGALHYVDERVK